MHNGILILPHYVCFIGKSGLKQPLIFTGLAKHGWTQMYLIQETKNCCIMVSWLYLSVLLLLANINWLAQYLYELKKWLEPIVHVPNWRNRFLGIMVPGFYLKYAVFLISEVVLGLDWPPIFKGWWQSFMYLPQKYFFGIMVLGFYLKYAVFEF